VCSLGLKSRYHIPLCIKFMLLIWRMVLWKNFCSKWNTDYLSSTNITIKYFCIVNSKTEYEKYNLNVIRILRDVYVVDVYCYSEIKGPHIQKSWGSKYDISFKFLPEIYPTIFRISHTDINTSSGIRTHDPSVWAAKTVHALHRAATVIGTAVSCPVSLISDDDHISRIM
jgi:hypothetical protein